MLTFGSFIVISYNGVYAGVLGGSSFLNGGSSGYYWSSTANDVSYAYYLNFSSFYANTQDGGKGLVISIRCVAKS